MLTRSGRTLLTDFGSVAPLSASCVVRKYCRAIIGTPDYIAPEILRNFESMVAKCLAEDEGEEREAGGRSHEKDEGFVSTRKEKREKKLAQEGEGKAYGAEVDWWSLGVIIYEVGGFFNVLCSDCSRIFESEIYSFFLPASSTNLSFRDRIPSASIWCSAFLRWDHSRNV